MLHIILQLHEHSAVYNYYNNIHKLAMHRDILLTTFNDSNTNQTLLAEPVITENDIIITVIS